MEPPGSGGLFGEGCWQGEASGSAALQWGPYAPSSAVAPGWKQSSDASDMSASRFW
jgi:hypothetical protein